MSQFVETNTRTFTCGAAIAKFLRVKLNGSGKLAASGINDVDLGTLEDQSFADGDLRAVRLMSAVGTRKVVAAGAIAVGAYCYQAASGKVNDIAAGKRLGVALEAAAADADVIEIMDAPSDTVGSTVVIEHHTANDTLTSSESGSVHTNLGASAAITITLPQDATAGVWFRFAAMAAQELRVDPGAAGAIYVNGAKQTDDKYVSFDDEAESLVLTCDGNGDWIAGPSNGTFTVEV